ncbi:unnamed protein product [Orchesella dallaii]|uniref:Uncharacterized protein n=1 Tax=Orchesella dallaii TaxID=48710 RepID=A0ABP1RPF8_9HEXA
MPPSYVCGRARLDKGMKWLFCILTLVLCSLAAKHYLHANILPTFGWKDEIETNHFSGSATCQENDGVFFSFSLDETKLSSTATGSLFEFKKELADICDQLNVLFQKSMIYINAPIDVEDDPAFVVIPICHLTHVLVAVAGPDPIKCSRYRGLRRKVLDAVCVRITEIKWKRTFTIAIHLTAPDFETEVHEKADKGTNHNDNYARCRQRNGPSALHTFFKPSVNDNTMSPKDFNVPA